MSRSHTSRRCAAIASWPGDRARRRGRVVLVDLDDLGVGGVQRQQDVGVALLEPAPQRVQVEGGGHLVLLGRAGEGAPPSGYSSRRPCRQGRSSPAQTGHELDGADGVAGQHGAGHHGVGAQGRGHRDGAGLDGQLGGLVGELTRGEEERGDGDVAATLAAERAHRLAGGRRGAGGVGGRHGQLVVLAPQPGQPGHGLVRRAGRSSRRRRAPGRRARAPGRRRAPRASARRAPRGSTASWPRTGVARTWRPGCRTVASATASVSEARSGRHSESSSGTATISSCPARTSRSTTAWNAGRHRCEGCSRYARSTRRSGRCAFTSSTRAVTVLVER